MQRKLVDHLIEVGLVEKDDIQRCVLRAKMGNGSVVDEMMERIDVDEQKLASAMAEFWGLECWEKSTLPAAPSWQSTVPKKRAEEHGVLPVAGKDDDVLRLAIYDVDKAKPVVEEVRQTTGVSPELVVARREVVQNEINRHYNTTALSGMFQLPDGRAQAEALTRKTPTAGLGSVDKVAPSALTGAANAQVDDAPTRQIDLSTDNPFMDLVQESAEAKKREAPTVRQMSAPKAKESRAVEVEEAPEDFFSDLDDPFDELEPMAEESSEELEIASDDAQMTDGFGGALEDFDAELDADESEVELLTMGTSSSVNWGAYGDEYDDHGEAQLAAVKPESGALELSTRTDSHSGLLPKRQSRSGDLGFSEGSPDSDLTLAEVVAEQRKMIRKLEREIEYQKGLLQTLAELLVDARVISRKKLKSSLKAFKEKQRKKYE